MPSDRSAFIVGVDGSDESRRAFDWACRQAGSGTVDAVYAFSPFENSFFSPMALDLAPVRAHYDDLVHGEWTRPPAWSTAAITRSFVDDTPIAAFVDAASKLPDSTIVVGHHASGRLGSDDLGHVTYHLLRQTDHTVVIVNDHTDPDEIEKMVVVAVHGPAASNLPTLRYGAGLAARRGARLHLVAVTATDAFEPGPMLTYGYGAVLTDPVPVHRATSTALDEVVREMAETWPDLDVSGTTLSGHPVSALAEAVADVAPDIVVVGNHHHSMLTAMITDSVLRHLPSRVDCPVAAVRVDRSIEDRTQ